MKKIVIPTGITQRYQNLYSDEIVVNGHLIVEGALRTRTISGKGFLEAETLLAHNVVANSIEVQTFSVYTAVVKKLFCYRAIATQGLIATEYLKADTVQTAHLTYAQADIRCRYSREICILANQRRSFVRAIFLSWIREKIGLRQHVEALRSNRNAYGVNEMYIVNGTNGMNCTNGMNDANGINCTNYVSGIKATRTPEQMLCSVWRYTKNDALSDKALQEFQFLSKNSQKFRIVIEAMPEKCS